MSKGFIAPRVKSNRNLSINERLDRLWRAGTVLSEIYDEHDTSFFSDSEHHAWKEFDDALRANEHHPSNADRNGRLFEVGARVVAYTEVERFPHFLLPPGTTGTVVESGAGDGWVEIRVDDPWAAQIGPEWEYAVQCSIGDEEAPAPWSEWVVTTSARREVAIEEYAAIASEALDRAMAASCWADGDLRDALTIATEDLHRVCDFNVVARDLMIERGIVSASLPIAEVMFHVGQLQQGVEIEARKRLAALPTTFRVAVIVEVEIDAPDAATAETAARGIVASGNVGKVRSANITTEGE